ncbi:hypothetical protein [Dokdonella ginsengisoli]|uniref:Uncharacterized protein n=1 Tax=Dokdonella ginsengisoli TaxID=363846 RepID=A0ABV9QXZ4_9GAMM
MKNKMLDLRNHLFATIEAVLDLDEPMDIDRARVVAELAQVAINSAKVEVEYLRVTMGVKGTGFILDDASVPSAEPPQRPALAARY